MKTVFLVVVSITLASVAVAMCWFLGEARHTVADADKLIQQETTDLHGSVQDLNAAIVQIETTTDEVRTAAESQEAYWAQTSEQTAHLIKEADKNLNGSILPATAALIKESDAWLQDTDDDAQKLTVAANASLDSITLDADVLHERFSDPQIPELLSHFNVLALHLDTIAGNSEAMSEDMKLAVHRLAAPPSKLHTFLDASYTTLKFGSLFVP